MSPEESISQIVNESIRNGEASIEKIGGFWWYVGPSFGEPCNIFDLQYNDEFGLYRRIPDPSADRLVEMQSLHLYTERISAEMKKVYSWKSKARGSMTVYLKSAKERALEAANNLLKLISEA